MINRIRKQVYRVFCILALLMSLYLMVGLLKRDSLEIRPVLMFILLAAVVVWGIWDWTKNSRRILKQEEELRTYQMYIRPLEEMVKEIRSSQHEFDNHLNALLGMHMTVDNYEELVERQSSYIREIKMDPRRKLVPLLKISDKILAGFLYSKIISLEDWVEAEIQVGSPEILSGTSEHDLIEAVGTLVDNAREACTKERNRITMFLDSEEGRLVFEIENQVENMTLGDAMRFFEKGYSGKESPEDMGKDAGRRRGYGLYNAKSIIERHGGSITVSLPCHDGMQFIAFRLEL